MKYSTPLPYQWILPIIAGILFFSVSAHADDYEEYARKVRENVWSWHPEGFERTQVPEKYKNESAVVLAAHSRVLATGKNRVSVAKLMLGVGVSSKIITRDYVYRARVLIQDQAALEQYSQFDYQAEAKSTGILLLKNRQRVVFGARIVKPDGAMHEVNVGEAVSVTSGKKDKEAYKKLAIPDLRIGDIIDYFFYEEVQLEDSSPETLVLTFSANHPMLVYSVQCELAGKLTTEYRSLNGAPEFTCRKNEEGDVVLEAVANDLPKRTTTLWYSAWRQLPIICLTTLNHSASSVYFKPKSARPSGVHGNVPPSAIQKDAFYLLDNMKLYRTNHYSFNRTRKLGKDYQKEHPEVTNEALADYLYDTLNLHWMRSTYTPADFIAALQKLFDAFNIRYSTCLATSRGGKRMEDVVEMYDYTYLLKGENQKIYMYLYGYGFAGEIAEGFDGEPMVRVSGKSAGKAAENALLADTISASFMNEHFYRVRLNASVSSEYPSAMELEREMSIGGSLKSVYQRLLLLYEDWQKAVRQRLGMKESILEQYEREEPKYAKNLRTKLEDERKEWKNKFAQEAETYHEKPIGAVKSYALQGTGAAIGDEDLRYSVTYIVDDLLKKAGDKQLLAVGQLLGGQLTLNDRERNRTVDIYSAPTRVFEYDIAIALPTGYQVENESLAPLQRKVDNDCGTFVSEISSDGDKLRWKVTKYYKHAFEPVANWPKLLEILDAASALATQSVVLKKL